MVSNTAFDVQGQVFVITGASSGLGAALAAHLDRLGARLVLAARREHKLRELASTLKGSHLVKSCDVTSEESCLELVDASVEAYGRIDVLVNNAGKHTSRPAESESVEDFRGVIDTNVVSTYAMSKAVAAPMRVNGGGSIINIASVFGLSSAGAFPIAPYAASKAAVISLTRELAAQWARDGIRVNSIAPAFFESEMTSDALKDPNMARWVERRTPMGRPARVEELFGAIIFLASGASSYVTGATLPVDGGWTAI